MANEHFHGGPEHQTQPSDSLEASRHEKFEELRQSSETLEDDPDKRAEAAREIIHAHEAAPEPEESAPAEPQRPLFRLDHKLDYAHTMASVQRQLAPLSRSFSKLIHTPVIEKTSETLENSVARPSVVAGATWTALIVGLIFYLTARYYGYRLSGSEMLSAFVFGAILGLAIEGFWRLIHRRR